jgi:hypothetical protein
VSSIRLVQLGLLENDHFLFSRGIFVKNVKIIFKKYFQEFSVIGGHMHWLGRLLEASISLARKHLQGTTHISTLLTLFSLHTINRPWAKKPHDKSHLIDP